MKKIIYYFLIIILIACNNQVKSKAKHQNDESQNAQVTYNDTLNNLKEDIPEDLIDYIIYKRTKVKEEIKNLDKNNCTDLYVRFKIEMDSLVRLISNHKENLELQDNYYSIFFDSEGKPKKLSKSLKSKLKRFDDAKLELWDVGEGMSELRTKPDFYTTLFEHKLNSDYDDYIHLIAKDDAILYAADAGLIISHRALSERVLHWEKFLQKHTKSKLRKEVLEIYKYYQQNYIIGLDNTPFRDYETNEIYPEAKEEFLRFTKSNPKSVTSSIVLKILDQKLSSEEIYKFLEREQLKLK